MKRQLVSCLAISFFTHILIILSISLIIPNTLSLKIKPTIYNINLIEEDVYKLSNSNESKDLDNKSINNKIARKKIYPPLKIKKNNIKDSDFIRERIDILKAKKNIEQILQIKKTIDINISKHIVSNIDTVTISKPIIKNEEIMDEYYAIIADRIRQGWIITESQDKKLETVISVIIGKDGFIESKKLEKSSGNFLFDHSALRAVSIYTAIPLPPPPNNNKIEIGLKFYP